MTNRLVKAVAVMAAVLFLGSLADPDLASAAGKVNSIVIMVKGKVEVQREGAKDFAEVKLNDMLYAGDVIRTGEDSQASLATKGGAEVRLNANSSFEVTGGTVREKLSLKLGQLWTRMLHKRARLDVRTPSAVCAVRGTEADIEQRDLLTVKVYEGPVDVSNSGGKQSLGAGQMSTVTGAKAAPAAPRQMGAGDKGTWQDGLNKDPKDIQNSMDMLTKAAGMKKVVIDVKLGNKTFKLEGDATKK